MSVRTLPGVGPATAEVLRRAGITTVGDTAEAGEAELLRLLGRAHGTSLYAMANGWDDRPVIAERDAKSVSVEDTFDVDLTDRALVQAHVARLAGRCTERLRAAGRSGRTVVIKVRSYDFSTLTRSETLRGPTDDTGVVREAAARLIDTVDTTAGVRLLGVGVSGLADFTQEDLFAQAQAEADAAGAAERGESGANAGRPAAAHDEAEVPADRRWVPGRDVRHAEQGHGWVQGSGLGRVTVRFESPGSPVGRVRTYSVDEPALEPAEPLPLAAMSRGPAGEEREDGAGPLGRTGDAPQLSEPAIRPKSRSGGGGEAESGEGPAASAEDGTSSP